MQRQVVVRADWHRFEVTDGAVPETSRGAARDASRSGLVRGHPTGVEVITGVATGPVKVELDPTATAPGASEESWEDIAEASVQVIAGPLRVRGPMDEPPEALDTMRVGGPTLP
jgi:hypothetical protein